MQAHIRHRSRTHTKQFIEQKFIFQVGTLSPHEINERLSFH